MKVGSLVICVNNIGFMMCHPPIEGEIYTVREVRGDGVGILLEEIINPIATTGREHGYYSFRFREI